MPAGIIDFAMPGYEGIRKNLIDSKSSGSERNRMSEVLKSDQDNDQNLLKTKVFENFFQQKNDTSRKKVLLVISGSHITEREGQNERLDSQSYPKYLKAMAQSNPDCDFLVLNIDPKFNTNQIPTGIEIEKNVDLKFLKGHLNPVKNPQFYSEIGNNLHRFDKVVFCSHTCQVGALDFQPLHRHCQKQGTDCITIGAYFNRCACCIIKKPLIKPDYVPLKFFEDTSWFIDSALLKKTEPLDLQEIADMPFISNFLLGSDNLNDNKEYVATKKNENPNHSLKLFTGIEDENFIKAVTQFVREKEVLPPKSDLESKKVLPPKSDLESKKVLSPKSDLESKELTTIFGLGTGAIVGLTCVSALGLGIVSAPAFAIVAGTTIAGATAFYLINQEIQKNNPQK